MPKIDLAQGFGGERPRLARRQGGLHLAEVAEDVNLAHGTLKAWASPLAILSGTGCIGTFHASDCCFYSDINECASFAENPGLCDRVFATGICGIDYPVYAKTGGCGSPTVVAPNWKRLGLPRPDPLTFVVGALRPPEVAEDFDCEGYTPPAYTPGQSWQSFGTINEITVGGNNFDTCTDDHTTVPGRQIYREHRDYVYTYINECGEESAPSVGSVSATDADADSPATITLPPLPSTGNWNIVGIRIYRIQSGNIDGSYKDDAAYLFVDEIDLTSYVPGSPIVYLDSTPVDMLGEPVSTDHVRPPPIGMAGIIELEHGALAGFVDNKLYITEPHEFHAWGSFLNLDDNIVSICEVNNQIYVATDGHPYLVSSQPNQREDRSSREILRINEPYPCLSNKSMVETINGAMWASQYGLVRMTGASVNVATHDDIAEDDWKKYSPQTMRGAFYKGRYYGFSNTRSFIFDFTDGNYNDGDVGLNSRLSSLTIRPTAVFADRRGRLFLAIDDEIVQWDAGSGRLPYRWRSHLIDTTHKISWTVGRVTFEDQDCDCQFHGPVKVRVMCGKDAVDEIDVVTNEPFRIKRHPRGRITHFELIGKVEVSNFTIATSLTDLIT